MLLSAAFGVGQGEKNQVFRDPSWISSSIEYSEKTKSIGTTKRIIELLEADQRTYFIFATSSPFCIIFYQVSASTCISLCVYSSTACNRCVILSIPSGYDTKERQILIDACQGAGYTYVHLVSECGVAAVTVYMNQMVGRKFLGQDGPFNYSSGHGLHISWNISLDRRSSGHGLF